MNTMRRALHAHRARTRRAKCITRHPRHGGGTSRRLPSCERVIGEHGGAMGSRECASPSLERRVDSLA